MAYRRVRKYRRRIRRPLRKYRRRFRRIRKGRYSKPGNLYAKFTRIHTIVVQNELNTTWDCSFQLGQFSEWTRIGSNFEMTKVNKVVVKVIPMQNVSNNSTSSVPSYCIYPWHYGVPIPKDFGTLLSVDKAKIRPQTVPLTMSFVPNTISPAQNTSSNEFTAPVINWKPTVQWTTTAQDQPLIRCGALGFQGDPSATGRSTRFNIVTNVYVEMRNQSIINGLS
ncbi:Cap protein [Cyclovirus NGchicken15/NGA/2009]|uniref:Cap protein n=1 Tax=Cyclovirus NGchicken15/NGA/2009 TaxID=942037 RepID=E9NWU3_9CIRC|nr:Cap protein [Cyclovirus NGchicken15/NGA/2009]ADU77014.1 Cap protein [Cyclovirus NGchicken15/NGA/2009]